MSTQGPPAPKIIVPLAEEARFRRQLQDAFPEADIVFCPKTADVEAHLGDAEAIVGGFRLPPAILDGAPRLRWIQTVNVGVERLPLAALAERGVVVTNVRGVNVAQLGEHALMLMLSFVRAMPELYRRQATATWRSGWEKGLALAELSGARLGLVGYGQIGRAVAARAKAFGMEVWALRRSASATSDDLADRILGPGGLHDLLGACDHVVVVAPSTPETRGMFDAAAFARMKPGAYFYNLGRGDLVVQDALIAALQEGRIAGAGLDVTTPEPLPADSPLWTLPNVIITGHSAGDTPGELDRAMVFFADQLARFRNGEPLRNRVDSQAGY
jgi:phosphoglycerate dehydrogenase-like enzyme